MSRTRTYLDCNATAPLRREARAAMIAALDVAGNPSSPHAEGRRARGLVEDAREQVAALVDAKPAEVVFTSGGTEANNAVLAAGWSAILVSGIEHDSVLAPARGSGAQLIEIPVGSNGVVRLESLAGHMTQLSKARALVSLQMANNETGALQPVADVAALAREHGLAVHSDAVQAAGRVPIEMARARRRLPDALRPQARRTQGRGRAGHSRRRQPARLHHWRRPGAAPPRGHRECRGHRRFRRGRRGGPARSRPDRAGSGLARPAGDRGS